MAQWCTYPLCINSFFKTVFFNDINPNGMCFYLLGLVVFVTASAFVFLNPLLL